MSNNTGNPFSEVGIEILSDQLNHSSLPFSDDNNKPNFRQIELGSPVSPLTTRTTAPTPSSSSSSGSSARNPLNKGHSSDITDSTPRNRPGHPRSDSRSLIYSGGAGGGSSVNSPPLNVLPTGNICSTGRTLKTGMMPARVPTRTDVLGSGTGNYGHGSIMRAGNMLGGTSPVGGDPIKRAMGSSDPEEVKRAGNDQYKKGHFTEALSLYDRAIELSPCNAAYRSNRAAALTGLGRVFDAIRDCEDAIKLDPHYGRAHLRLGSLLIRLGQVDIARKYLFYTRQQPEATELHKLQAVEKHLSRCSDARRIGDWKSALLEGDAAITAGADYSPQILSCKAESLLKLQQLDDIDRIQTKLLKVETSPNCCSQSKFFGMLSEAYLFYVRAQIEMAFGRFEDAVTCAEKAGKIDPRNIEVVKLLNNVRLVARARTRGNDLFKSERFTEACQAYGEGLKHDPCNSVLYCNRAASWSKLGMWEKSIDDCNSALRIHPSYTKALLRRAASYNKLEQWAEAVRDYEALKKEFPHDSEVAKSLLHAQVALKKLRGEEFFDMKVGGDVEDISGVEQFRAKISSSGVSVVHFGIPSNPQCKRLTSFLDILCSRYPSINFGKVNVEESTEVANAENVRIVPTFKIYKNGIRMKEIVNPTSDLLEASVKYYSF